MADEGTVIRATFFFNLSRNIVVLQIELSFARIITFVTNLSHSKI